MRNSEKDASFEDERAFFLLNGGNQATLIPRINLSSYKMVLNSTLAVSLFSTLGYEALGLCKRVIFSAECKNIKDFFTKDSWRINYPAYMLPDLLKLQTMEYSELFDKATKLLEMPHNEYLQYTNIARHYYMNLDLKMPPQIIIKNEITKILNNPIYINTN